ncbi:MAG: glycosyltransferase [Oscillospiraceae bacterium]|nr:glycosyltransferase [Oscillospiraceae bacterium]
MNEGPLLSIVVPVYNVEQYLARCLDSILSQTLTDFEVIAVDDGSPDNCGKILDEYSQKDKRIKVIHKENGGVSSARNAALDLAQGEYIGFVDSDDYIEPNMYEYLVDSIKKSGCDIVICGYHEVLSDETKDIRICERETSISSREGIVGLIEDKTYRGYLWNRLYKRELFDGIRFPETVVMEDLYVNHLLFEKVDKIYLLDKALYYYIRREDSVTMKRRTKTDVALFRYHMGSYDRLIDNFCEMESILNFRRISAAFNVLLNIDANKLQSEYPEVYDEAYNFLKNNSDLLENNLISAGKRKRIQLYLANKKVFFVFNRLYNIFVHRKNTFECL